MALSPEIGGFLYSAIRETWYVTAVAAKYLILADLGVLAYKKKLDRENFEKSLLEWGKTVILTLTAIGAVLSVTGVKIRPFMPFLSQLIAAAALAYLFWQY